MTPNLYAVENFFALLDTTSADVSKRKYIAQEVLTVAEVSGVTEANCCFAQLLNPGGLETDYLVSHYWETKKTFSKPSGLRFADYRVGEHKGNTSPSPC